MTQAIAIVGMACRYPDARSPAELWENALAGRRAFRRIPPERLRLEDYLSADTNAPDHIYSSSAALIEGYEFDRVRFSVSGSVFRSADTVHWLTLDVASQALADAGFAEAEGLPRNESGVILGNTLTGEIARANMMRLRWPYVRRVVASSLLAEGWSPERLKAYLELLETEYKRPFPPVGEETLAGNLSNTIAGRVCNYFNLKGGGYTVDGACAASMLAVTTACSALAAGDLDVALAGGVDLSLDPFELVGFAKSEALASDEMLVYDANSTGFLPGEGCGFIVLMRYEEALSQRRRIYAVIRGWGVSSDGSGGITRPDVEGQLLALQRCYRRAGFGIETVAYFEGHGTGTKVGDATELRALSRARNEAKPGGPPAIISSIKANIGHTKAAAGIAGLIKATMALHTQVLPPATACYNPHLELNGETSALKLLRKGELWPPDKHLRAGVSAMGFGGINTHVVLEGVSSQRRKVLGLSDSALLSSAQDAELFLLGARNISDLESQVKHLMTLAPRLSRAEMADLAACLEARLEANQVRAAIVASAPETLRQGLQTLASWLGNGVECRLDTQFGVFLSVGTKVSEIGFLFPGQGSPWHLDGGALRRRFQSVDELYGWASLPASGDSISTAVAQPAIVTASLAALRVLGLLGISASIGAGHSLGELTALHWAGAFSEEALLRIATARGKVMAESSIARGAMASIRAESREVEAALAGRPIVIACFNSPQQTVISGEARAVASVSAHFQKKGVAVNRIPVSCAFHSTLVAAAAPALAKRLAEEEFHPLQLTVISSVTGSCLAPDEDLKSLLYRQVTSPVQFIDAITAAARNVDLFIEVGPGHILSGLATEAVETPVIATDAGGRSLKGLLQAVGAAFVLGSPVRHDALFAGRFTRPFDLNWQPKFFANPCELAPIPGADVEYEDGRPLEKKSAKAIVEPSGAPVSVSPLELLRQLVAQRAELPLVSVKDNCRLLSDLHLNSITVSQVVAEAARQLGLGRPVSPTDYSNLTVSEAAQVLEDLARIGGAGLGSDEERHPSGVDSWVRTFTVEMVESPRRSGRSQEGQGVWKMFAPAEHPMAGALLERLGSRGGGVVVCLPPEPGQDHLDLLLDAVEAVLEKDEPARFVLVQHGGGAASLARTLHLEVSGLTTCVVDVPLLPQAIDWALAEIEAAVGYTEAQYDSTGRRFAPFLRYLPAEEESLELPLGPADVLLVTGGGKGITAECALALAQETGARLALLGRSDPSIDSELAANLKAMADAGIRFEYIAADITDAIAAASAVAQAVKTVGPITAILHGAAINVPQLLLHLDRELFKKTSATKVWGMRNVLAAVDPSRLKLLVTFGSIISRTGLPGEAHYGLANEWLTRLTEQFQKDHPSCQCQAVEWSAWSDTGMAQRIGAIERLVRAGMTPITPQKGVMILRHLLGRRQPQVSVVVTGRCGEFPTLKIEPRDLPILRFLERPRLHYPGVELIADSDLSVDTDPYLNDHIFQGERLFPAVMGLEAMAQAAMGLCGLTDPPALEEVKFARPIVVPEGRTTTIRAAALVTEPNRVEVVLRSSETAFQVDHFRAACRFQGRDRQAKQSVPLLLEDESTAARLPLNPERDLYGTLLFHSGRFRRLRGYRVLKATECLAEVTTNGSVEWFGQYMPADLLLGDPAVRDAAIHAIQACIPHAMLLPVGVDRALPNLARASGRLSVHARERKREGDIFTYDLELIGADGRIVEQWEGLRLQVVSGGFAQGPWPEPLLGPYIEHRVQELVPGAKISVVAQLNGSPQAHSRSDKAIQRALGEKVAVFRLSDGRPRVADGRAVSTSHAGGLTLAIAGNEPLGCDIELVANRPESVWQDLLGFQRFSLVGVIGKQTGEDLDTAATRVWTASECLKKAGTMLDAPLVLGRLTADGWLLLLSGPLIIATYVAPVRSASSNLAVAVLLGEGDASF